MALAGQLAFQQIKASKPRAPAEVRVSTFRGQVHLLPAVSPSLLPLRA